MRLVSASGDPGGKESDHRHRRLLRACPERPRDRCAAEQCDEFPALHGLPSSDGTPQTTTPLRENAAVHHSKIDRRMERWVMYGRRPRCKRNLTISEAFGCGHVFCL